MEVLRKNRHLPLINEEFYEEFLKLILSREPDFVKGVRKYYALDRFSVMLYLDVGISLLRVYDHSCDLSIVLSNNRNKIYASKAIHGGTMIISGVVEQFECFSCGYISKSIPSKTKIEDVFEISTIAKSARN
jgi:hypothetical protein